MEMKENNFINEFQTVITDEPEFLKKCSQTANDIQVGSFTILQLVEKLKILLVDLSPENREHGMRILSQVIQLLPKDYLNTTQLDFICAFYKDRLNDHHQVVPAVLNGILAIIQFNNLPEGVIMQLLAAIFLYVPCQQQQQPDRYNIYQILKISSEYKIIELQQMAFDFIYGVISSIDGERDPRNLLFLFSWLPNFLQSFTFDHLNEEIFEVLACYFPVDFKAPSQNPNNISREMLADALSNCLCAINQFAEFCLPLALEKLSSSLAIAKLDSLQILAKGCKTFGLSEYIQHSTDFWSQIQREVLNSSSKEIEQSALETFEVVMRKLSNSPTDVYKRIVYDIIDTLKGNLLPTMKLFMPSCKMLYHVAKASQISANYINIEIVPILVNTFSMSTIPSHQALLLKYLVDFLQVYVNLNNDNDITKVKELSVIPSLCLKATLLNDELKIAGFSSSFLIADYLPSNSRIMFYEILSVMLIKHQSELVRLTLLKFFKKMAELYTTEVQNNVLDKIVIKDDETLKLYLDAIIVIADQKEFTHFVLPVLINYCLEDIDKAEIATRSLKHLLEINEGNDLIQTFLIEKEQIIQKLIQWVLNHNFNDDKHKCLMENISSVCKIIIGYQSVEVQQAIVYPQLENLMKLPKSNHNYNLIMLLDGLLTRLRKDIVIEFNIVEEIFQMITNSDNLVLQEIAIQLLANILNKSSDDEIMQSNLNKISNSCDALLNKANNNDILTAINIISWVTKALVMKDHKEAYIWTNKLLDLLEIHKEASKGFKIILEDCASLSNKSFCNIRLLYRQKFFTNMTERLVQNYKEENSNYLLAFGYLLQKAPQQVFIMQFKKIIKLIIICLERCEDSEVLCAILDTLYNLIQSKESLIEEYVQEFLPRFLKLTIFKSSMHVRIKALQCIQGYTSGYPLYKLLPHKQEVIYNLTKCLDDTKRLVRKEAVEARMCWYMLDAPI